MTQDLKLDSAVPDRGSRYNSAGVLIPGGLPDALEPRPVSGHPEVRLPGGHYANVANEIDERAKREDAAREDIKNIHAGLDTPTISPSV